MRSLRALYSKFGYRPYRMSKFEEYDLYAGNRSFLPSGGVITFTDTNGRLMALKPDVTLSIAKNLAAARRARRRRCITTRASTARRTRASAFRR